MISPVDLDDTANERTKDVQTVIEPADSLSSRRQQRNAESKESTLSMKHNVVGDGSKLNAKGAVQSPQMKPVKEFGNPSVNSSSVNNEEHAKVSLTRKSTKGGGRDDLQASSHSVNDAATDPTLPTEVITPVMSYLPCSSSFTDVQILELICLVF